VSGEARTQARFPDVPLERGHYESFFAKASHPARPLGLWIRYTVHKRPGQPPRGSLWLTLFDGEAGGPTACKATLPSGEVESGGGDYIRMGESRFAPDGLVGSMRTDRCGAAWELRLDTTEPPFRHLPRDWMYRAAIPRTKLLSPHPAAVYTGYLEVDGRRIELDGWPGTVGHNWGAQHAERWIWMHGASFEGRSRDTWFDAALGRIKVGPFTTPWIGNARVTIDGIGHRLGGPERLRSTKVGEAPTRCEFILPGREITLAGVVEGDRKDFVGWVYADPDGSEHHTVNCSIARMTLQVSRPGHRHVELTTASGAAYELGMRERDHGIEIQPFPDG
jgi:hypothetical protein